MIHIDVKELGPIPEGGGWRAEPSSAEPAAAGLARN